MKLPGFHRRRFRGVRASAAFTLLEMIIAMVVVVMAMLVVVQAMARVQDTWKMTNSKVREAQDARAGLETMSRTLTRATLNGRWATNNDDDPSYLQRESDLHFVCGPVSDLLEQSGNATGHAIFFQAPIGYSSPDDRSTTTSVKAEYDTLPGVLNAWGYFVEFGEDPAPLPSFITGDRRAQGLAPQRNRFRLMEFRQPAHELDLFQMDGADPPQAKISQLADRGQLYQWFRNPLGESASGGKRRCVVVAENILAVIFQPIVGGETTSTTSGDVSDFDSKAEYLYDSRRFQWDAGSEHAARSRHRLPAALKVKVIVLDERDWDRLSDSQARQLGIELRGQVSSRFQNLASFTSDMGSITGELNRRRMRHRVISSTMPIPGGRWTTDRETD